MKPFAPKYRTYEGERGSPQSWRAAFHATMNLDEAAVIVGSQSPEHILGVLKTATMAELVKAYRAKAMLCHPDRCAFHGLSIDAATERFKLLFGAFTILSAKRRKL